jgi:hypothetical protein
VKEGIERKRRRRRRRSEKCAAAAYTDFTACLTADP